jgi:hypothetical protein
MLNRRKLILGLAPAAILPTASATSLAAVSETRNEGELEMDFLSRLSPVK